MLNKIPNKTLHKNFRGARQVNIEIIRYGQTNGKRSQQILSIANGKPRDWHKPERKDMFLSNRTKLPG